MKFSKLLIAAYGLSLLLIGLGLRTLTRHEVLAAYPAKEMIKYGHWIVPMFAGIPRTAKPPGMYWIIAGFMKTFDSDSEWVVRLPSVLAAVALALMIASFAAKFYGQRIGVISGLIQLTCIYVLIQARLAESDMLLCALVSAAMLIFAAGPVAKTQAGEEIAKWRVLDWHPIVFYALTGATFLLKGFVGPGFILLGGIVYSVWQKDWRAARFLLNPIGILIFVILITIWPMAAYHKYPAIWESWRFEQVGRLTGERGNDPFYFYLYSIPGSLLPWTPLMILAAWTAIKSGRHRRPLNGFFICWFVPGVILLSCSAFKHQHYAFPLLPPASILGAIGLLQYIEHQHRHKRPMHGLAAVVLIVTCVGITIAGYKIPRAAPIASSIPIIMGMLAIGGLVAIYMESRRWLVGQLIAIFATAWIIPILVQVLIIPTVDDYRIDADLARSANEIVPADQKIFIIDPERGVEPHCAYYLRPPIWRYRDAKDFLDNGPGRDGKKVFVIASSQQGAEIAARGRVETLLQNPPAPVGKSNQHDLMLVSYLAK